MTGWLERRGANSWRLNVNAGTGPDGRRKIFRKTVEATSEREAKKLLAEFAADVLRGVYIEPAKLTFRTSPSGGSRSTSRWSWHPRRRAATRSAWPGPWKPSAT